MSQAEPVIGEAGTGRRALKKGIAPAIGLFFVAPLVAEFLLGNLPIKLLPALIVLAPLYGVGAVLIREMVRRTGVNSGRTAVPVSYLDQIRAQL
jgi:hypothetical protein